MDFIPIMVRYVIQLYQTGANDHQFHMYVETQSFTEREKLCWWIKSERGPGKLFYQGEVEEERPWQD